MPDSPSSFPLMPDTARAACWSHLPPGAPGCRVPAPGSGPATREVALAQWPAGAAAPSSAHDRPKPPGTHEQRAHPEADQLDPTGEDARDVAHGVEQELNVEGGTDHDVRDGNTDVDEDLDDEDIDEDIDHDEDEDDDLEFGGPLIHDYSYKPRPFFHGDGPLFLGLELEVATPSHDRSYAWTAHRWLGSLGYLKSDSSIDVGFEIVTHPMSYLWAIHHFPWEMLPELAETGCRATQQTGLHVHLSRDGFTGPLHVYRCYPGWGAGRLLRRVRAAGRAVLLTCVHTICSGKTHGVTSGVVELGGCRVQRVVLAGGEMTWTVLGADHRPVAAAEAYLEFLRVQGTSPNTVKSYARALALWWQYLTVFGLAWDSVRVSEVGGFLAWLRTGDEPAVTSLRAPAARFGESTIAVRLSAVMSCYDFHELNGVRLGRDLHRLVRARGGPYKPMLEHVAGRHGRRVATVRVRRPQQIPAPILTPGQIEAICEACAAWDPGVAAWRGSVRDRLLWSLLAGTGLRLGEALGLQHRDWHTGCGDTPFLEVVPREHPHGVRVKGGRYRKLYIGDDLDRLYGEYVWQLCEAGADLAVTDFDASYVFVNLVGVQRFSPWRPDSVYDLVKRLHRRLGERVPAGWTPHWMRHSHATALLLAGVPVHVVARRLGHADVQTTLNLYAHVTQDAELRAVADWAALTAAWRAAEIGAATRVASAAAR